MHRKCIKRIEKKIISIILSLQNQKSKYFVTYGATLNKLSFGVNPIQDGGSFWP